MNRMADVARLFNKKLGEEFKVKTKYRDVEKYRFTTKGVVYYDDMLQGWSKYPVSSILQLLLTGEAVIVDD